MKRISEVTFIQIVVSAVLIVVACLLIDDIAQAQAGRFNQRQIRKLEKQAGTMPDQSQEKPAPTPNEPVTQPNRLKALQQGLQPANPRLQAIVLDRFLPRLDLTEEQRTQVQNARSQHIRRLRTLVELERAHTKAYDEALFDLSLDAKEIEKRAAQLAEVRTDMLNAQARLFLDLRRLLTPEQFTKLRQLMEEERALKRNAP
ncbi:MAG: hypothetical protein JNM09_21675 [Blastocatellia bacterium]|nr:hypothetical protein [Blastocatellia bacterium]